MSKPDFRALCEELLDWAERTSSHYYKQPDVILRARAALAQPKPVANGEVAELVRWLLAHANEHSEESDGLYTRIAKLLQHQHPQPQLVAPTDEEIDDWHSQCADLTRRGAADHHWAFDLQFDEVAGVVRAALVRWGRPANTINQEDYE